MAASAIDASAKVRRFRGLALRAVSAVILAPLCLTAIWIGFPWIDLMAAAAAPIMIFEWIRLTPGRLSTRVLALFYGMAAIVTLLWLRHQPVSGRETVVWIMACVWATDIGAYFTGRLVGGAKLAPTVSPGKTWSGLFGGMGCAGLASAVCGLIFGLGSSPSLVVVGAVMAVIAQMGDLLESAAKRRAGLKDSGRVIAGHGGLLDRIDGLMAVLVAVAIVRLLVGGGWPWE